MMNVEDITQLPERYQKQILQKLKEREQGKPVPASVPSIPSTASKPGEKSDRKTGKYRNIKTDADNIRFDSKKEARRFLQLKAMEQNGEISDLRLQVNFTLQEGYTKTDGERVRPIVYKADFTYKKRDENGRYTLYIVEDVKTKGTRTEKYKIKRKLFMEKFQMEISEV